MLLQRALGHIELAFDINNAEDFIVSIKHEIIALKNF